MLTDPESRDEVASSTERYSKVAIALHWAIAAFILFNLGLGFFMEGFSPPVRGVILPLHVSSGISVLVLTIVRVGWRLTHTPPPFLATMPLWERNLAQIVHFLLYAGMVLMPLTGWAILSAHPPEGSPGALAAAASRPPPPANAPPPPARRGPPRIWGVVPLEPIAPIAQIGATEGGVAPQHALHDTFAQWHGLGGFIMILLLLFHVGGALKHQLIDREPELQRMGISGRRRRRTT